jgi:hypothetical protein
MKEKLENVVHEAYRVRIGGAINEPAAEAVFAAHRPWIEEAIAAATAEATADMDERTRERYAAFMVEQLDRDLGRLRAEADVPVSDLLDVRVSVYGERRR